MIKKNKKIKKVENIKDVPENKKNLLKENKETNYKKSKKINKVDKQENLIVNKKVINSEKIPKQKNNKIKNFPKKRKIDLQSYKIILILKDVDPKDPTEELSSILSNSEVNFEIEKIERILDSKNKSMNKSRNCIRSPSNAVLVPLLKCNRIIGRGNINLNKAPPIGK